MVIFTSLPFFPPPSSTCGFMSRMVIFLYAFFNFLGNRTFLKKRLRSIFLSTLLKECFTLMLMLPGHSGLGSSTFGSSTSGNSSFGMVTGGTCTLTFFSSITFIFGIGCPGIIGWSIDGLIRYTFVVSNAGIPAKSYVSIPGFKFFKSSIAFLMFYSSDFHCACVTSLSSAASSISSMDFSPTTPT